MVEVRQCLSIAIIIIFTSLLGACQLTDPISNKSSHKAAEEPAEYSQYYLWLKSLSEEQVLAEEARQTALIENQLDDRSFTQGKLILIYSLPSTPLHHPYRAKRLLNEHLLTAKTMGKRNLAFTLLLRDQLNSQLYLLKTQLKLKQDFAIQNNENHASIEKITQELDHMKQQLMLLKQIDQNINDRG